MSESTIAWNQATVLSSELIAEHIRRIELAPATSAKIHPGQHVKVHLPLANGRETRSYSVIDTNEDFSRITLSVLRTRDSRGGSEYMHALRPGDEITLSRPIQNFPLRVGAPSYVLLAGGIGITAISAMADLLHRLGADYRLIYAARSPEAMAYAAELTARHGERLELHLDSEGTSLDVAQLIESIETDTELYMCGPIRLMDAVRRTWYASDLDPTNLRFETFGNSGWFRAESFTVEVPQLGIRTLVGRNESLLEALQRAGAPMMYDCRKGECGLCEIEILNSDNHTMDHRDVFLSDRQKAQNTKICACVSRAVPNTSCNDSASPTALSVSLN